MKFCELIVGDILIDKRSISLVLKIKNTDPEGVVWRKTATVLELLETDAFGNTKLIKKKIKSELKTTNESMIVLREFEQ